MDETEKQSKSQRNCERSPFHAHTASLKMRRGWLFYCFRAISVGGKPSLTLCLLATADSAVPCTDILADLPLKHLPSLDQTELRKEKTKVKGGN